MQSYRASVTGSGQNTKQLYDERFQNEIMAYFDQWTGMLFKGGYDQGYWGDHQGYLGCEMVTCFDHLSYVSH